MKPFFSLHNVHFSYDQNCVFEDIDLDIFREEIVVISGENGTGKSTLCKILFGLLRHYTGEIAFEDKDFRSIEQAYLSSKITYIQEQNQHNILGSTPDEDLAIWQHKFQKSDNKIFKEERARILERFGLQKIAQKPLWELSAGQQKRVVLASLLLNTHTFRILDDPLFSLDSEGMNILLSILARQKLTGLGALIATQRPQAFTLVADRIYEINNMKITRVLGR